MVVAFVPFERLERALLVRVRDGVFFYQVGDYEKSTDDDVLWIYGGSVVRVLHLDRFDWLFSLVRVCAHDL
jgi:hypothetical protein